MTETETRLTVFGRVVWELGGASGIDEVEAYLGGACEDGRLPNWPRIQKRMYDATVPDPGYLNELADVLGLDSGQRRRLSWAYAYEQS